MTRFKEVHDFASSQYTSIASDDAKSRLQHKLSFSHGDGINMHWQSGMPSDLPFPLASLGDSSAATLDSHKTSGESPNHDKISSPNPSRGAKRFRNPAHGFPYSHPLPPVIRTDGLSTNASVPGIKILWYYPGSLPRTFPSWLLQGRAWREIAKMTLAHIQVPRSCAEDRQEEIRGQHSITGYVESSPAATTSPTERSVRMCRDVIFLVLIASRDGRRTTNLDPQ
ncbi:hypothetical protein DEU56DRAFT_156064 [Suillus clintonianus]|uniref:uncharacterized protein n=1 Tax=Suillus clintonianus TaxID=1904413 RepID=UPI001B870EE1|nr:uncharacterized protein DEU56DRAFT_156064 [Suillus clintonianus]KAG2146806.1 hypothetical protein DEU56DRAFT_156064 [Suillus clintonianus]